MLGDPDITVMGSRNGLGKTSVIECCSLSLLLIASTFPEESIEFELYSRSSTIDIPDLLIKAGSEFASIKGDITLGDESATITITIRRNAKVTVAKSKQLDTGKSHRFGAIGMGEEVNGLIQTLCGFTPNPVIRDSFLLFHSYRKVQEGNLDLRAMIDQNQKTKHSFGPSSHELPMSEIKVRMLRLLMTKAGLFDFSEDSEIDKESDEAVDKLNKIMEHYVQGKIDKLRPSDANTIDFRVMPTCGKKSFTFDGLSSGQKEIISTLFLIWWHTRHKPCVVLIDEPELHFNSEWQRTFVHQLNEWAPENQYILATHSEDFMDTVSESRRVLLIDE